MTRVHEKKKQANIEVFTSPFNIIDVTRYLEQIKRFVLIICCNFLFIKEPVYAKPAIRYEKDKTTKGNINICVLKITLFKQIR